MTESHIRNVIEAALLAAGKPLQPAELVDLFDEGAERPTLAVIQAALAALAEEYSTRGVEVKETAAGFRIQVRSDLSNEISRLWPERPPKYSRALLETLAIIAYRQPITRAEIEAVRGVAVNPNIVKTVIERNWVHVVGHRDVPGRPELLGTTRDFLDYFGLKRLDELPPLADIKALGEIKVQFDLPDPGPLALLSDASSGSAEPGAAATDANAASAESGTAATDANAASAESGTAATDANALASVEGTSAEATAEIVAGTSETAVGAGETSNAATDGESGVSAETSGSSEAAAGTHEAPNVGTHAESATSADAVGDSEAALEATNTTAAVELGAAEVAGVLDSGANVDATAEAAGHQASAAEASAEATAETTSAGDADTSGNKAPKKAVLSSGRGAGRKKKRGKTRTPDSALHEAEEFAASVDADLAAGEDDSSDEDELSAAGPDSSELVAGPRDIDD